MYVTIVYVSFSSISIMFSYVYIFTAMFISGPLCQVDCYPVIAAWMSGKYVVLQLLCRSCCAKLSSFSRLLTDQLSNYWLNHATAN